MGSWLQAKVQQGGGKRIAVILFLLLYVILIAAVYTFSLSVPSTIGIDWTGFHRPAVLRLITGQNPYALPFGIHNPPWAYLLLTPIALLPERLSTAIVFVTALFAYGYVAVRLGAKPIPLALFLTCPLVLQGSIIGTNDWMVPLGLLLPPQFGLFLILIKPQMGIGVAVFWLIEAWRSGRVKEVFRVFAPVTIAYLISFLLYGLWPFRMGEAPDYSSNTSFWPDLIPLGLVLLVGAIRKQKRGLAICASPFLSPYIVNHSWAMALLGLLPNTSEFVVAIGGVWLIQLLFFNK